MAPEYLSELFSSSLKLRPSRYQLRSSQSNQLIVPPVKLSIYGPRLFAVAGPTVWQWRFYVVVRGAQPPSPNLAQAPQIFRVITVHKLLNTGQLDTVVLLVVASQMMRGQAPPNIFS